MKQRLFISGFFCVVALCLLSACHGASGSGKSAGAVLDSIQVEKVYHLLDNPDNPNCNLTISFTYPVDCPDKQVLPLLQKQFVSSYFGEDFEHLSPTEAVAAYTEDYLNNYKELEDDYRKDVEENETPGSWYSYYEMWSDIIRYNENNLFSYTVRFENYTGGAHGSHSSANFTLDMRNGKRLTEDDLFREGYQDMLAKLLVYEIAKKNQVDDPKELEDIGYFSVDEIYPNNNFYIDETGITYTFNEYEIAAYALGETDVHLSFDQIRNLLKEDNPLVGLISF